MSHHRWTATVPAVTLIVGCSALLASCSSSGSSAHPTTGTPSASSPRTSVIEPGGTVPFKPADNARSEVQAGICTQVSGAWKFSGSVHNATKHAKNFQLVVDFVTKPGSTVLTTSVVSIPAVGAGATTQWSVSGAAGKSNVACVLRQAQAS